MLFYNHSTVFLHRSRNAKLTSYCLWTNSLVPPQFTYAKSFEIHYKFTEMSLKDPELPSEAVLTNHSEAMETLEDQEDTLDFVEDITEYLSLIKPAVRPIVCTMRSPKRPEPNIESDLEPLQSPTDTLEYSASEELSHQKSRSSEKNASFLIKLFPYVPTASLVISECEPPPPTDWGLAHCEEEKVSFDVLDAETPLSSARKQEGLNPFNSPFLESFASSGNDVPGLITFSSITSNAEPEGSIVHLENHAEGWNCSSCIIV